MAKHNYGLLKSEPTESHEEDGEEFLEDGVLFYVNKGGFPINDRTWDRMWAHIAQIHPNGYGAVKRVRGKDDLPEIPVPQAPTNFPPSMDVATKLETIQKYMNDLQYNHTGTQFFEIKKGRPIAGHMETAREMIKEALPIKCLEAVILGINLTNNISGMDRFTLSFKTTFSGNTHRHVVLGVYHNGLYGALGMSRRQDLMYKPLTFQSLTDLIMDFINAYKKYCHRVKKVKAGLPIPQDGLSYEQICWKHLILDVPKMSKDEMKKDIERCARELRSRARPSLAHEPTFATRRPSNLVKHEKVVIKSSKQDGSSQLSKRTQKRPTQGMDSDEDIKPKLTNVSNGYQVRI